MKYRPKHIIEYVLIRSLAVPLRVLPYHAALFIGWLHACLGHYVVRFRVAEARRRIRLVLGDTVSEKDVRRIAWVSWRNLVFTGVETMRMGVMDKGDIERIMDNLQFFLTIKEHCDTGRGAVAVVSHMGSWEICAAYLSCLGVPIFTIVGKQRNPLVNDYLNRIRQDAGVDAIPRHSASLRKVIHGLKHGKVLGIMADVRMRTGGITVPFLGGEANVGEGMAMFARQCDVPIIIGIMKRQGWSRHEGICGPILLPDATIDKETDVRRMTTEILAFLNTAIREDPAQWFWYNKRWILDPVEPSS